jgi:hypothetical protein
MQRTMWILGLSLLGLAMLGLGAAASAGDKKKDDKKDAGGPPKVELGPEHQFLASLVGTWDAKARMFIDPKKPAMELTGTMTRTMVLDGHYLQETYKGQLFGNAFTGMGMVGFDQNQKRYFTAWFDSMSTNMIHLQGEYDAKKKTLTFLGTDFEPNTKKKMKARDVLRITGPDTQVFEMYRQPQDSPDEFKVMEITYTRKKGEKK